MTRRRSQGFDMAAFSASQPGSGSSTPLVSPSGFFGGISHLEFPETIANVSAGFSAALGFFCIFYLPQSVTITKATVNVNAVSALAGKQLAVGIYAAAAGSPLLASAEFNVSAGRPTGVRTAALDQGSVTLPAGFYFYSATMNDATVSLVFWSTYPGTTIVNIANANFTRAGTTAPATPGTLDPILGALTASTTVAGNLIATFFE